MADFIVEWTEAQQPTPTVILDHWKMYFNGSLRLGGAGDGVLFTSLDGKQLKYVLQILWPTTNNEAEYEALLHGLEDHGSSVYSSMVTPRWLSTRSTRIGSAPRRPWTLTA